MVDPHDLVLKYYDKLYPHREFLRQTAAIRETVLHRFKESTANGRIRTLDLCTGTGRMLSLFKKHERFDLVGVDKNDKMLELATKNYPNATFVRGDICDTSSELFLNRTFHCILIGGASIQLFDCNQRHRIFSSVKRLLADDGVFIFDIIKSEHIVKGSSGTREIRLRETIGGKQVTIMYRRVLSQSPILCKQYVHLIERDDSEEPTESIGEVDIYEITPDSLRDELGEFNMTLMHLPTQKKYSEFFIAEKRR